MISENVKRTLVLWAVSALIVPSGLVLSSQNVEATGGGDYEDFWVYGNLIKSAGQQPEYAAITILNERTNETMYTISGNARYKENLANFTSGYERGDNITIESLDINATGDLDWNTTTLTIPPYGDEMDIGINLIPTERPDAAIPDEPPYGSYGESGSGEDLGSPDPGEEETRDTPSLGGEGRQVYEEEDGPGPLQFDCDPPQIWGDPWIVWYDQHCIDMTIDIYSWVLIDPFGDGVSLTLENVDLYIKPLGAGVGIEVNELGSLLVTANSNGESRINWYTANEPYTFDVYGYLEVSGSIIEHFTEGIHFRPDSSGLFDGYGSLDTIIGNSDSTGIFADSASQVTMSDTQVYGHQGHGVHLEDTYALIENSHIWDNDESGVHVSNRGLERSCYGQPEIDSSILAYWAWCDDEYWHLQWTTDGSPHYWEWEIQTENDFYPDDAHAPGGVYYEDSSPWAEYTLKVDGNLVAKDDIFVGYSGDHPASNPFTLSRRVQPIVRNSWIESNTWGISSISSAPTIVDNVDVGGEGGIRDNEIGIRAPKSAPVIYHNDIWGNTQNGIWTGVYLLNPTYYIAYNTVRGPITPIGFGIYINAEQETSQIKYNEVSGHKWGIYIGYGQYYVIEENAVHDNSDIGIYAYGVHSDWVKIANNDIHSNPIGVDLRMSPSVTAEGNTVRDNSIAGIQVRSRYPYSGTTPDKPVVKNNEIYGNTNANGDAVGIKVREWEDGPPEYYTVGATPLIEGNDIHGNDFGVGSTQSGPNIKDGNQIHDNTWGVYIEGFYDDHGNEMQAAILGSSIYLSQQTGIWVVDSSPTIEQSDIYQNMFGLVVDYKRYVSAPQIDSNDIYLNQEQGIHSILSAPQIALNTIESNKIGVYIYGVPPTGVPIVIDNTISDNLLYGIFADHSAPEIIGSEKYTQVIRGNGLGIYLCHASPHIFQNKIVGKVVMEQGPGPVIRISLRQDYGILGRDHSSPLVEDNYIGAHRFYGMYFFLWTSGTIIKNQIVNNWWWGPSSGIGFGWGDHSVIGGLDEGNTIYGRYASISASFAQHTFPVIEGNSMESYYFFDYVDILTMYSSATIGDPQIGKGNVMSGAMYGIWEYAHSSSAIRGNTISATSYFWPHGDKGTAIKIDWYSSTTVGEGNEITDSVRGIMVMNDANPNIHQSFIASNDIAIHITPTAGANTLIQGNQLYSNGQMGIFLEDTSIEVGPLNSIGAQNEGNGIGIYVSGGSPTIKGNIIEYNDGDGLLSDFATPTIGGTNPEDKNVFNNNVGWAVHTRGAEAENKDSLLTDNDMSGSDERKVWHQWQLTIHVQDSNGDPIQGADAWSWCQMLGVREVEGQTDENGDVIGWATEYQIRVTETETTLHDIYANWGGYPQEHWDVYIYENWVETFIF